MPAPWDGAVGSLKISKDQCKTGGGHDTQSECEAKGANYVWCGPA